jgi:hypothetical protein
MTVVSVLPDCAKAIHRIKHLALSWDILWI